MTKCFLAGAAAVLLLAAAPAAHAQTPACVRHHDLEVGQRRRARPERERRPCAADLARPRQACPSRSPAARSTAPRGTIEHSGGLKLLGRRQVAQRPVLPDQARAQVDAERAGRQVARDAAERGHERARITRVGLDTRITRVRVSLTGAAAKALNTTLLDAPVPRRARARQRDRAGDARDRLARVAAPPPSRSTRAPARRCRASASPRHRSASSSLAFPITGGTVNAKTFAGSITHSGGIALSRGATRVELTDFTIGIDDTPDLTALVGGQRVPILTVDLSALKASVKGRKITLSGAALKLTAAAAGALNQAFATTAFTEGLLLGTATVQATAE